MVNIYFSGVFIFMQTCAVSGLPIKNGDPIYLFPLLPTLFRHRYDHARAAQATKDFIKAGMPISEDMKTNAELYKIEDDAFFKQSSSGAVLLNPGYGVSQQALYEPAFLPLETVYKHDSDFVDYMFPENEPLENKDLVRDFYNYASHYHLGNISISRDPDAFFLSLIDMDSETAPDWLQQLSFAYVRKDVVDKLVLKKKDFLGVLSEYNSFSYTDLKKELKSILKDEHENAKPLKQRHFTKLFLDPRFQFLLPLVSGAELNNTKFRRRLVKTLRNPYVQNLAEKTFILLSIMQTVNKHLMPQVHATYHNYLNHELFSHTINYIAKKQAKQLKESLDNNG